MKEFGHLVSEKIYDQYKTKNEFLRETGIDKMALHLVITGKDARLSSVLRLAKALSIQPGDLLPKIDL